MAPKSGNIARKFGDHKDNVFTVHVKMVQKLSSLLISQLN